MTRWPWADAVFAGVAQVLFSNRGPAGVVFLAAVAVAAPWHALTTLVAVASATALAAWWRWNPWLLRDGVFGYNAALVGLVWPALFAPASPGFWMLVPAAAGATWLQGWLLPAWSRRDVPVLGVPFLVVTWGAALAGLAAGWRQPLAAPPPLVSGPLAGWHDPVLGARVLTMLWRGLPVIALAAGALVLASRSLLLAFTVGTVAGLAVTLGLGGLAGVVWVGAFAYNAAPAAAGLVIFLAPRGARLLAGSAGAVLAAAVWALATPSLLRVGLLPLTGPAHLALYGVLGLARSPLGRRLGLVTSPPTWAGETPAVAPASCREEEVAALAALLRRSRRIVVLSGAGMSTESGIPDYRSCLGFWFDAHPDDLTYQRFLASERSRRLYWRLQHRFMRVVDRSRPNAGHLVLARLGAAGRLLGVITQNVDGLHQAAGTAPGQVVELHGSARWVVCVACRTRTPYRDVAPRIQGTPPPCTACGGLLKTETVSFGEPLEPARLAQAAAWCRDADLMLVLGSALQVEPARSLPKLVHERGAPIVTVNRTATPWDAHATLVVRGDVGVVLGAARRRLGGRHVRPMTRPDFQFLCGVVDAWWGDDVRYLLHPLWVEHFADTALVLEDERGLAGFLIGFISQSRPGTAYVHLIATAPDRRGAGGGRLLYEHFFGLARAHGCSEVQAITVPQNAASLGFHRRLGFQLRDDGARWQGDVPVVPDHAGPGIPCVLMTRKI